MTAMRRQGGTDPRPTPSRGCTGLPATRSTTTRAPKSGSPVRNSPAQTDSSGPTSRLDLSDHGDDLAEHGRVVSGDGIERRVVRHTPHLTAGSFERLDCGLAVDHRRDGIAVGL